MMPSVDPFSPGTPIEYDDQFIDQERVIQAILKCLDRGKSCSIIGGIGMGKTSILKHIKRMFSQKANAVPPTKFRFIPIYFKPDLRRSDSLRSMYQQLIAETIFQTKEWLKSCAADVPGMVFDDLDFSRRLMVPVPTTLDEDYRAFEGDLHEIIKAIRPAVVNTKLLFLLDEMYLLEDEHVKEDLARHWFELLNEENTDEEKKKLRPHLTVIMTCFIDHHEQFIPRRPNMTMWPTPGCKFVRPIYLHVFERADAWKLIRSPFEDSPDLELTADVADEIYIITGGHPLLLQSAMSDLWGDAKEEKTIDITCVRDYIPTWREKHPEMYRWIGGMITENQMLRPVLRLLLTEDEAWEQLKLAEALERSPDNQFYGYQLQDALRILTSWGVVREVRKLVYKVSGELFREWFKPLSMPDSDDQARYVFEEDTVFVHKPQGNVYISDFQKGHSSNPESS